MARHRYLAGGLAGALLGLVAMLVGAAQDRTALAVAPRAQAGAEPNQATAAVAAGAAKAKPQPVQESTRVQTTVGAQGGPAERTWDIRPYLAMEDTQQAASELRAYAQGRGLSLEARKLPRALPGGKIDSLPQEGIVVFNGTTLPAQTGVEESLAARADQLATESRGQETIVAILQVREDLRLKDVIELLELGVKFHEPLGHAAAIVRLPAAAVPILAGKAYIRWIGEYKPAYKYRPEGTNSGKGGALVQSLGGDRPAYRADLARLGIPVRGYDATSGSYDVLLEEGRFGEVAAELWWVRGLTKEPEETPAALGYEPDDSRQLILAFETAYNGTGVPIGVRDTGVNASHPDLVGHLLAGSDALTNSRHGTVVCSILMGRGTRNLGCTYNAKGVAFGSDVLFKNTANSYASAFAAWQAVGIQISNHSYSFTGDAYAYDANTAAFDGYADSDDAVILAACGDSGTAVTNPATGKNVLAVGAITYADSGLEQIGARASYSNPGPTRDDHRLKPELVAPGGGSAGNTYGVVGANDTPDGVATGDEWPADDQYVRMSGTSMAAPHVAGVCAKIKQWKQDIHSELLKALLINTTIPIKANSPNPLSGYANTAVGYGMVNGYSVTEAYAGESQRVLFVEDIVSEDARTDQWPITVPAGTRQLVVTLAYNDLAGALSIDRAVKDDLDLSLTSPGGVTTHAYVYKAAGVTRESPLEKMVMAQPAAGTWTVRVEFSNSPRFSDPLLYAEQRYALVGHVILKAPALEVTTTQALYEVAPRAPFVLTPTVTNTGGYIAAGVSLKVLGPASFGGEMNTTRFVGSLPHQGAAASAGFALTAPDTEDTYTLTIAADGVNREFGTGYPQTRDVQIRVGKPPVPAPTNVSASDGTTFGKVHVTWTPVAGFTYYQVYRSDSPGGPKTALSGWLEMGSYDDTSVAPAVLYYYWVRAAANNNGFRASAYAGPDTGWCQQPMISGRVRTTDGDGMQGVEMQGLPASLLTNERGTYKGPVPYGWTGTVRPRRNGYTFTPASRTYSNISASAAEQNYTAKLLTYTISGHVRDAGGAGAAGVVLLGLPGAPVTDASGYYEGEVDYDWWGNVTPMQSGYRFSPPERAYSQVRQDVTQQDYERWQGIDLQVSSFTYSVPLPSPAVGEPITLVVRIVNNGSVAVPTARVDLWKNRSSPPTDPAGSDMSQILTNLLPEPNNPVEVQFEVVYPQPGQYTLWVLVTPEGSVADSNPADNLQQITLQVKGPAPDLVVEKIDPIAQYPPAGRRFSVSVTIRNQGVLNAGPFRVDLWKDQLALPTNPATSDGGQLVNSLARGASVTLSYDISYPTGGLYNLWVVPDSLNSVSEMDEANNARAMGLAVNRLDGDADGDGQVNVVDLMLVIGASSSRPGDATWNRACDFDDDDYVGPLDLLAVHDNYGANLLAGRWGGAAQYNVEMTTDGVRKGGFSFQQGLALTFDNAGRPRSLDLCLGEGPKVLWLSTEGLSSPGDTAAFCFHDQDAATGALTIRNVTALVNSVSYSKHRYAIELQITESSSGAVSGFASGLYNRTASVQADGTLLWTGSTSLLTDPAATAAPAPVLRATLARRHTPTILSASG